MCVSPVSLPWHESGVCFLSAFSSSEVMWKLGALFVVFPPNILSPCSEVVLTGRESWAQELELWNHVIWAKLPAPLLVSV